MRRRSVGGATGSWFRSRGSVRKTEPVVVTFITVTVTFLHTCLFGNSENQHNPPLLHPSLISSEKLSVRGFLGHEASVEERQVATDFL